MVELVHALQAEEIFPSSFSISDLPSKTVGEPPSGPQRLRDLHGGPGLERRPAMTNGKWKMTKGKSSDLVNEVQNYPRRGQAGMPVLR
jgi:hypothetical protein